IALNIALDFVYFYIFKSDYMKISGLALGNTSAYLVGSIWVLAVLRKRLGTIDEKRIVRSISKIIIASIAMGASCWGTALLIEKTLGTQSLMAQLLQVFLPIAVSLLVYLSASILLKSEEMNALKRLISRFLRRKQSELEPIPSEPTEDKL
ncbi:MAG: polysaccharide biosynthesis C-terminal domain-containing protein, partial [Actinomycetota bacterium]|nr:polysaccharide biosynthesis C-terminal domain-containing protein [Actinomycetota bacterium]